MKLLVADHCVVASFAISSKVWTVYRLPLKASSQRARVNSLPGAIVTVAVLAVKSTSIAPTPSTPSSKLRTRAAQPLGQVIPLTWTR